VGDHLLGLINTREGIWATWHLVVSSAVAALIHWAASQYPSWGAIHLAPILSPWASLFLWVVSSSLAPLSSRGDRRASHNLVLAVSKKMSCK